jgi:DNA-binding GntR family transcriptional regulator
MIDRSMDTRSTPEAAAGQPESRPDPVTSPTSDSPQPRASGGTRSRGSDSAQARVVEALRRDIGTGALAPRSQVSESALATQFGTSRTPIREALKQLQIEGLVKIIPRVGTFVTEPSWQEIVELSQVKEMLEALAARLVAQRADMAILGVLERNLAESTDAMAAGDIDRYVVLVREFHDVMIRGANNQKLLSHYRVLMNQFSYNRLVFASLQQPGRLIASLEEHRSIVRAITARDPDAAELSMRSHANQARRALAASLLATSDGPTGNLMLASAGGSQSSF